MTQPTRRLKTVPSDAYVAGALAERGRRTAGNPTPDLSARGGAPVAEADWVSPKRGMSAEDLSVWRAYRLNPTEESRNALIERYLDLVGAISERLSRLLPPSCEAAELYSPGVEGLIRAVEAFNPERGVKFETYCSPRIRGSMLDYLRDLDFTPRRVRYLQTKLERAHGELERDLGRAPTPEEIREHLGLSESEYREACVKATPVSVTSLDQQKDDDEGRSMSRLDMEPNTSATDPMEIIARKDLMQCIQKRLEKQGRLVLALYYHENLTMKQIGGVLGLSESRVSQIHSRVLDRLRGLIEKIASGAEDLLEDR